MNACIVKYALKPKQSCFAVRFVDGSPDEGKTRDVMLPLLKHTRICTFTNDQLCKEVLPADVITMDEFKQISAVINKKEEQTDLATVCNIVQSRPQYIAQRTFSDTVTCQLGDNSDASSSGSVYFITTGSFDVKLESISLKLVDSICNYKGSISVKELDSNTDDDEEHRFLADIDFNQTVPRNEKCQIPMQSVEIKAATKYELKLGFKSAIHGQYSHRGTVFLSKYELRVENEINYVPFIINHLSEISYKVAC